MECLLHPLSALGYLLSFLKQACYSDEMVTTSLPPPASSSRWQLAVRDSFAAAHALRNYHGKCERLHGHNFSVEVKIEGNTLSPDTELLLDFGILKLGLKSVLESLDHQMLNDLPPFTAINPSSENIARHIFHSMASWLLDTSEAQAHNVRLVSVTVGESDKQCATYMESYDV